MSNNITVYEHRTSLTAASGSVATTTLKIYGGLLKNVYIKAMTDTTTFKANLVDDKDKTRIKWSTTNCEINDMGLDFPLQGQYTLNITNASPDDTFDVILAIQE